jgi:hypothetical protein
MDNVIELAVRRNSGVEVRLLWHQDTDEVAIALADDQTGTAFELPVTRQHALDAYRHPFVYARWAMPVRAAA